MVGEPNAQNRTVKRQSSLASAVALAATLVITIGVIALVVEWYNHEVRVYKQAVAATIQVTIGACGMGNVEFHMPAEAKAQVRAGCIKDLPKMDEAMEP